MKDDLGQRMKDQYENRTRYFVPRRTYTIIRLDGKAFHTYTKNLNKPFDLELIQDLDNAVVNIMSEIQGAAFAYVQSDEISILLTDFEKETTDAWFDGNIQKITSVSASLITAEFNKIRWLYRQNLTGKCNEIIQKMQSAYFDSRVFTIPDRTEVMNYFVWRNQDCARNAVSMVAQSKFSHKELQGKSTAEMQEMLFQKHQINWSEYSDNLKNGRLILKEKYIWIPETGKLKYRGKPVERSKWISKPAWKFTQDKEKLLNLIPKYN